MTREGEDKQARQEEQKSSARHDELQDFAGSLISMQQNLSIQNQNQNTTQHTMQYKSLQHNTTQHNTTQQMKQNKTKYNKDHTRQITQGKTTQDKAKGKTRQDNTHTTQDNPARHHTT
jgi:hypothetical protein